MEKRSDSLLDETTQPPKAKALEVKINMRDMPLFKGLVAIIGDLVIDERIPQIVREEYVYRMISLDSYEE